jgi:hypothetical protein
LYQTEAVAILIQDNHPLKDKDGILYFGPIKASEGPELRERNGGHTRETKTIGEEKDQRKTKLKQKQRGREEYCPI